MAGESTTLPPPAPPSDDASPGSKPTALIPGPDQVVVACGLARRADEMLRTVGDIVGALSPAERDRFDAMRLPDLTWLPRPDADGFWLVFDPAEGPKSPNRLALAHVQGVDPARKIAGWCMTTGGDDGWEVEDAHDGVRYLRVFPFLPPTPSVAGESR